jgi:hypothetical protein
MCAIIYLSKYRCQLKFVGIVKYVGKVAYSDGYMLKDNMASVRSLEARAGWKSSLALEGLALDESGTAVRPAHAEAGKLGLKAYLCPLPCCRLKTDPCFTRRFSASTRPFFQYESFGFSI